MKRIVRCSLFLLMLVSSARAAESHYDLGGPCVNKPGLIVRELFAAKKAGAWDKVVELTKLQVRAGCDIQFRWWELVEALLKAGQPREALALIEDMDARGFDLNPALVSQAEARRFMDTAAFRTSPAGMKIEALKKISDERRAQFVQILRAMPASQKPAENYIARGACPFECCRYGAWTALKDTELVSSPGSKQVVGVARKGAHVKGVTGEVHLRPQPIVVLGDNEGKIPKNTIAFLLDYSGEGYGNVYSQGKIVPVPYNLNRYCFRLSESCWSETLLPDGEMRKAVWWVKIRLANGATGWTNRADNFDGKDGCG